jgi:hypothetical protein
MPAVAEMTCRITVHRHLVARAVWKVSATVRHVTDPECGTLYAMVYDGPLFDTEDEAIEDARAFAEWKQMRVLSITPR